MMQLTITINGAPRTKKNHGELVRAAGRPRLMPSKPWRRWRDAALPWMRQAAARLGCCPLATPINCAALFYRDARTGDAVGYYQGLADLLEEAGVVANDKWIETWDGSRLLVDRERPRIELVLTW